MDWVNKGDPLEQLHEYKLYLKQFFYVQGSIIKSVMNNTYKLHVRPYSPWGLG